MTKPFFIVKPVITLDNRTAQMYIKATIWIGGVLFSSLDEAWDYMLRIPNDDQRREIAKDIAHQQVLSAERMGYKQKDMARLLQWDWQSVGMAKETMTDLVCRLQPVVTALKKNYGNRSSTLAAIKHYWGQALYDRFENIDKALGSDKFFRRLGTVVRQYKSRQMLVAIWALNNITAHRLLTTRRGVPSDSYRH